MQRLDAFFPRDGLQPRAQLGVLSRTREQAARQRAVIKTRAADKDRQLSFRMQFPNRPRRIAREVRRGVLVGRIGNVDQVMRNATALLDRNFVGADVEAAIYRRGIAVDDLAIETFGNGEAQRTLASGCRAEDCDERFH